ncbi:GNAT family N-acetyltransferase [Hydrotalea sp.]|uniref:GNAT family N-acetyltransferase n=1 Tax=Hydrotalea sp. TaxID=2881279 RepID=UPI00260EB0E1|nr:GNAT family N-acetyltransferase [Hydrotalea sp.]
MAIRIIDYGTDDYQKMVDLRYQILRKPLGLEFNPQELEKEKNDILIGCFEEDKLEGCCILTPLDNKRVRLRQMAVIDGLQGKGIGRSLMNYAENIARDMGYDVLCMHARKTAVGFYEKLGYQIASEEFSEVNILHYMMEKKLI